MCETIEKITLLSVYFFTILWIKKIFEGDLVFCKNAISKQTRAAGQFKNFEAPWRSYNKMTKLHDLTVIY